MIPGTSEIRKFIHSNRALVSLGLAALLAELAYAILNLSAMPMYVSFTLKHEEALGLIMSTFLLTEAVSRPVFGALGDKIGRKPLLIAGPTVTAITSYLTITMHGPWAVFGLVALRALDGLGSGALWPTAFATIGDIVPEENRSTAMSMLNVTYMSGLALGFLMGGWANEHFSNTWVAGIYIRPYTASFYLVSILLALSVIVMVVFLPRKIGVGHHVDLEQMPQHMELTTHEEPAQFKLSTVVRSFKEVPDMLVLACVTFLGMGLLYPILKLYAVEHLGMSETQFGVVVAPIAAAMGIFAVPLGRLGDRYGKCSALSWGLLWSAAAMWMLALFRSTILAGLAGIIIGLGFTVAFPAWMALVSSVTDPSRRGEVLGAVGMAQGLAAIVGTFLGAIIYHSDSLSFPRLGVVNYNVPFWFSAILLSVGAVIAFTWVTNAHAHKDASERITARQRSLVAVAAILGLVTLVTWISLRYARPVAPDRVAWQWVQQTRQGQAPQGCEVRHAPLRRRLGWRVGLHRSVQSLPRLEENQGSQVHRAPGRLD